MSGRRSLVVVAAVAMSTAFASAMFAGCGLDVAASGSADGGAPTAVEAGPPMNAEGGMVTGDGGAPGFPIDATTGDGDGGGDAEAGRPADSGSGSTLSIGAAPASGVVDLTAEGTIDWAHWGAMASSTPVRRAAGGSVIGDYTVTGTNLSVGSNAGNGWPIFAKWSDGDASHPTEPGTNTFRYFTGSDDTSIVWTVPAAAAQRELGIYLAVGQAKARITATLSGVKITASHDEDTGAAGNAFVRVAIRYASPTAGATVQVRLQMIQRYNAGVTSALSFGSVTLH